MAVAAAVGVTAEAQVAVAETVEAARRVRGAAGRRRCVALAPVVLVMGPGALAPVGPVMAPGAMALTGPVMGQAAAQMGAAQTVAAQTALLEIAPLLQPAAAAAAAATSTTHHTTTLLLLLLLRRRRENDDNAPDNNSPTTDPTNNNDAVAPPTDPTNNNQNFSVTAPTTNPSQQATVTPELAAIMAIPTTDPRGGFGPPNPADSGIAKPDVVTTIPPGGPAPTAPVDVEIHAVIVSAAQSPWDAVEKGPGVRNVIIVGGIVALGKTPIPGEIPGGGPQPGWLRVIPDLRLLNGSMIPPVVPNIMDIRIMNCPIRIEESNP